MRQLLNASRYLVLAAVMGSLLSAIALYGYALVDTVVVILRTLSPGDVSSAGAKGLMLDFIEIFDLFLLGTVMLILALGLYELFIDSDFKMASRLEIHTFEDLKCSLVTVVVAVMAVTFLGQIMSWNGETSLIEIGVPVALVIGALNIYLWVVKSKR
ncbi:YqhA family protein [Deefgea rivuli]|uniref:YqhA family protein n=1 Tax=Deefgea rivuli TaxID=400948 RepID=UPI00055F7096|nr:YqhA family protein [Deefgea rivuli]